MANNKPDPLAGYGSNRMDAAEAEQPRTLPFGTYEALLKLGISERTCSLYGYQVGLYRGKPAHFAQISGQDGKNVATKIFLQPDEFKGFGSPKGSRNKHSN